MSARVLIIDDNRDHVELMAYLLRASGHKPLSATWGESGLGIALAEAPDLVICDLMLPRMSGFELARELKSNPLLKNVPMLAVGSLYASGIEERVAEAGFEGFIPKPITPETLVKQIAAFLKPALHSTPPSPSASTHPPQASSDVSTRPRDATILAVDDRPANLDLARSILEPCGYKVLTATRVQDALEVARKHLPNLVLADVHMGDGVGFDLVRTIKTDPGLRHIPCILISAAYLETDPKAKPLGLCDTELILRPIEPQVLLAKIEACLAAALTARQAGAASRMGRRPRQKRAAARRAAAAKKD